LPVTGIATRFNYIVDVDEDGIAPLATLNAGFDIIQGLNQVGAADPNSQNISAIFVPVTVAVPVDWQWHGFQRRHDSQTSTLFISILGDGDAPATGSTPFTS
jgi:hypothetical protein